MPVLINTTISQSTIETIIDKSLQEMYNPLVTIEPSVKERSKNEALMLAPDLISFVNYHLNNLNATADDTYTDEIVNRFYAFLNSLENILKRNQGLISWSIIMLAMSLFRQLQRDAEELKDWDLLFALNRLELDLLKMMNKYKPQNSN